MTRMLATEITLTLTAFLILVIVIVVVFFSSTGPLAASAVTTPTGIPQTDPLVATVMPAGKPATEPLTMIAEPRIETEKKVVIGV